MGLPARIHQSPAEGDAQWPVEPLTPHQRAKAVQGQFEASLRYARRSAAALAFGCAGIFRGRTRGNQSTYPHVLFISVRQAHCRCLFPAGTEITPESPPSAAIHLCTFAVGSRSG